MKLRHLFTINIFFAIFFGISCVFFPNWIYGLYGIAPSAAAVWMARLAGGSLLGFATLFWFGRTSAHSNARQAIAVALLINDVVGLIASLEIQLLGGLNHFGWTNPALYGLLALGYAYFLFLRPRDI